MAIAAAAGERLYKVQLGDTISAIAGLFGVSAQEVMAANDISDPTQLRVGRTLVIPGPEGVSTAQPTPTLAVAATATAKATATETGDTMRYSAPMLTSPSDGASYSGGAQEIIELRWESVGSLGSDEEYVVHLGILGSDGETEWIQSEPLEEPLRALSWQVLAQMHGRAAEDAGSTYLWFVQVEQVRRDEAGSVLRDDEGNAIRQPLSPSSEVLTFSWQ
jgi:murein DD-endopeptidase MepM/ murein hydrolase activator NlpD